MDPKFVDAHFDGLTYWNKYDYGKMLADFTEVIRLKPNYAEAYCWRGQAYTHTGELNNAIADYTEAVRLSRQTPRRITNGALPTKRRARRPKPKRILLRPRSLGTRRSRSDLPLLQSACEVLRVSPA